MNTEVNSKYRSAVYEEELKMWRLSLFDSNGDKIGGDILTISNDDVTRFLQNDYKSI